MEPLSALGNGEGQLNLVAWPGYAEDGSTDPAYDWVTPFETLTSCQVNVKTGATSDEMVQLMQSGEYDGVSASGDATLRLIAGGDVAAGQVTKLQVALPLHSSVGRARVQTRPASQSHGHQHGQQHHANPGHRFVQACGLRAFLPVVRGQGVHASMPW